MLRKEGTLFLSGVSEMLVLPSDFLRRLFFEVGVSGTMTRCRLPGVNFCGVGRGRLIGVVVGLFRGDWSKVRFRRACCKLLRGDLCRLEAITRFLALLPARLAPPPATPFPLSRPLLFFARTPSLRLPAPLLLPATAVLHRFVPPVNYINLRRLSFTSHCKLTFARTY